MERTTVGLVWVAGLCLAGFIYLVGPDRFLWSSFAILDEAAAALQGLVAHLNTRAYDMLRAAAIALFVVFWALGLVASRRGLPARWALFWVTLLFFILIWRQGAGETRHWLLAFILTALAAAGMTRRLTPPAALARKGQGTRQGGASRA